MHRFLILFLFLLPFFSFLRAQESNSVVSVEGYISTADGQYIENVHVVDITAKNGTTSNWQGQFRLSVHSGDTLRITCVGYFPNVYLVPLVRTSPVIPLHVVMLVDTLQVSGATIYPWPADVKSLKKAIIAMDNQMPKAPDLRLNDFHYNAAIAPPRSPNTNLPGMSNPGLTYTIPGPITALYNAFSKSAKSQQKYELLVNTDNRKVIAAKRYNADVVERITHFKSDKEIQDFMLFCNLQLNFILSSTEYELYNAIHNCLLAYNSRTIY